jgi:hypothetical protein
MCHLNIHSEIIYNMDEKGLLLDQGLKVKVIRRKRHKSPLYSLDGNRKMVAVTK